MMPVIVTTNPVLIGDESTLTADHPIIGWQNLVTAENVVGTAVQDYPPSNLANPATHLIWRGTSPGAGTVFVGAFVNGTFDYVAIARHNLGSSGLPVAVKYQDSNSPPNIFTLASVILPHDGPALFRFPEQTLNGFVYLEIGPGAAVPEIAVMYAGKLLVLPRKLYQGFAPIPYGRVAKVTNGRSEAGNFLGRIVLQEFVKNSTPLALIEPLYFRQHIAAFLIDSKENPFFIAWRPQTYPDEVGYCHMTNDPVPINEAPHGLIAMTMEMTGVV